MGQQRSYGVIMAGGVGSRFWPMSRSDHPKQFHDVLGIGRTLLQLTFDRLQKDRPADQIFVVTNAHYRSLVLEQLPELKEEQVLCEPARRNTAPCIAYAAYKIHERDPEGVMVVAPSDHLILKEEAFHETIRIAVEQAATYNSLVTLGIQPLRPDTGYGYIQTAPASATVNDRVKKVEAFTEKPDRSTAEKFLEQGEYYWNSGIFIWTVAGIIEALARYLPSVNALFREGEGKYDTEKEVPFIEKAYQNCEAISIDHGVMEKADHVDVIPADLGWSDLGTWSALHAQLDKDENNNAVVGDNVMLYDSRDSIIHVPKDKLVLLQGMDDMIVVESDNILLVCHKQEEQRIKQFVEDVKREKGEGYV